MAAEIATHLAYLRRAHNLSQEDLAEKLGLTRQAISRWERGESLPDTENLIALAELYDMTLDDLVHPKGEDEAEDEADELESAVLGSQEMSSIGPDGSAGEDDDVLAEPIDDISWLPDPEDPTARSAEPTLAPETAAAATARSGLPRSIKTLLIILGIVLAVRLVMLVFGLVMYAFVPGSSGESLESLPIAADNSDTASSAIAGEEVEDLNINWTAGHVSIFAVEDAETEGQVLVSEQKAKDDPVMLVTIAGGKLNVDYGKQPFGLFGCSMHQGKTLVVVLPKSVAERLGTVSINGASGGYDLRDFTADRLKLDLSSGNFEATNVAANHLVLDIASGSAVTQGSFGNVEVDLSSGDVSVTSTTMPAAANIEVASGECLLFLPNDRSGWTANVDVSSGDFSTGFAAEESRDHTRYTYGLGEAAIYVDIASGHVNIDPLG